MRPEFSKIIQLVYPNIADSDAVCNYPNISGVAKNLYFLDH